jgi:hypothetical protein
VTKIYYFFTLFLVVLTLVGCNGSPLNQTTIRGSGVLGTEERDVPSFNAIRVNSSPDVILSSGAEQRVVAAADDNVLPYLRTDVEGDTLVVDLRADGGRGLSITNMRYPSQVQVTAPNVTALVVNSSGDITAERLEGDDVRLEINSSGDITVDAVRGERVRIEVNSSGDVEVGRLEADGLDVRITSSGRVTVAGEARSQRVRISSSGDYEAAELRSADATVDLSSSGDATVWVTNSLRGDRSSSGQIHYYGNPASVRGEVNALGGR